jgi:zinc protease
LEEFTRIELSNGMRVLLKEIHTAPIISHWVWYQVGSADEVPGKTGVSHWVEHMQFKGTPSFAAGVLDKAVSREGGFWNAMTSMDWTTYFETMPADKIDLALRLEAERMTQSLFEDSEVESERTVVTTERQGNENSPIFQLSEAIQAAAFRVHPYHHEVIGDMVDLLSMTRQDLYTHYKTYYIPNNAVLAVAGDFDTEAMLERILEEFGSIPAGPEPPRLNRDEPEPNGEIRLTVEGPGETTFIQAAYRAPPAQSEDFFAFTVLDSLLTGPSSLNMFGGGISNNTSRLYQSLVEGEYAVSVHGGLQATNHPFLYGITLTMHPERRPEEVIAALDREIEQLTAAPPPTADLERAVKQARALFAYGSESISNQAFWLGYSEMFDSYDWFLRYLDRLSAVTPEDVYRVANEFLRPQKRVLGVYSPVNDGLHQSNDRGEAS